MYWTACAVCAKCCNTIRGENRPAGLEERTEGLLHTEERMKGRAAWSMA